ncbi:hypothetical protein Bxe_B0123 [Paraburkholderia xenovorans LB400]|uniref:Uncharacterized protein n=1 Tax=Paraburkholderia xenovorans (strain LB400) TaxID=266265 RepID=Q13JC6_PARXL|nr:hypothetical protein Bxe_B0123 [Paraburkholderia xenovorans LB400]
MLNSQSGFQKKTIRFQFACRVPIEAKRRTRFCLVSRTRHSCPSSLSVGRSQRTVTHHPDVAPPCVRANVISWLPCSPRPFFSAIKIRSAPNPVFSTLRPLSSSCGAGPCGARSRRADRIGVPRIRGSRFCITSASISMLDVGWTISPFSQV